MWTNFRDVRSMAEKITSVVAPQPNSQDDDQDYSDDEEDEGDDEYEEFEDEYQEPANDTPQSTRSPFSLVGMLSRAMDTEPRHEKEESHSEGVSDDEHLDLLPEEEEADLEEESPLSRFNSPPASITPTSDLALNSSGHPQHENSSQEDRQAGLTGSSSVTSARTSSSTHGIADSIEFHSDHEPQPMRYSLVRESGSLSPKATVGSRLGFSSSRLSVRSLGSTPSGNEVTLSPLKDIMFERPLHDTSFSTVSTDQPPVQKDSNVGIRPLDPLLGSFSVAYADNDDEDALDCPAELVPASDRSSLCDRGLHAAAANSYDSSDSMKRGTRRADSGILPKSTISGGAATRTSSLPTIGLGDMDEEDEDEDEDDVTGHQELATKENVPTTNFCSAIENPPLETVNHAPASFTHTDDQGTTITDKMEQQCRERQEMFDNAVSQIAELQQKLATVIERANSEKDELAQRFRDKEARLMQASGEAHEQELKSLQEELDTKILSMQRQLFEERALFQEQRAEMEGQLTNASHRIQSMEQHSQEGRNSAQESASVVQQQQARALRMTEDKLVQAMARLDERDETVNKLSSTIKAMEATLSEHKSGVIDAEKEMAALDTENEDLHNQVENVKIECEELRKRNAKLESDSEKLIHLKMELRMLKEDHSREQAKVQTVAATAESCTVQLESQRDEALARVHDLQLQLSAAMADIGVAKSDAERAMIASSNLQAALEAFQNEREAEMAMNEENRKEQEDAMVAAHAAVLDATRDAHATEIRQIQRASDAAVMNSMEEIRRLEEKLEMFRVENVQMRRSLDEAIKRLQATQDDVIDRSFMKNVLLDWLSKTDKKEKHQVLELMASVLHFTDAEKDQVNLDEGSSLRKLVAPPPSKVDLENLEGDNVREKWVNFLIAEAED